MATLDGTSRYRARFDTAAEGHFRKNQDLVMSSIGVGTYLGEADEETDDLYRASVLRAVELGSNVIDSAINYRFQRSERSVGAALADLTAAGFDREELIIATKAGFLSFDQSAPADPGGYFVKTYLDTGLLTSDDIAAGSHSMAPRYIENQLNRSLENLGLETIDIFYVHNPETQLEEVTHDVFFKRLAATFEFLETAVSDGKIHMYGTATWNAYRSPAETRGFLSLTDVVNCARAVGGDGHHFKVVQLPYNLAMREAYGLQNQQLRGHTLSALDAAAELGVAVMASASMMQARLASNLPDFIASKLKDLDSDGQRAVQFVRSTPGITTALVGMSQPAHVEENLALVGVPPAGPDTIRALFDAS